MHIKLLVTLALIFSVFFVSCDTTEINEQNTDETSMDEDLLEFLNMVVNDPAIGEDLFWNEMTCDATVVFTFDGVENDYTSLTNEDLNPIFDDVFIDTGIDVDYEDIVVIFITYENDLGQTIELDCEEDIFDYFEDCIFEVDSSDNEYEFIDCIDIVYPVTLHSFNSVSEVITSVTIENDDDLNEILDLLTDNDFLEFQYPIAILSEDGIIFTIENDDELLELLEDAYEECGEDCNSGGAIDGDGSMG